MIMNNCHRKLQNIAYITCNFIIILHQLLTTKYGFRGTWINGKHFIGLPEMFFGHRLLKKRLKRAINPNEIS